MRPLLALTYIRSVFEIRLMGPRVLFGFEEDRVDFVTQTFIPRIRRLVLMNAFRTTDAHSIAIDLPLFLDLITELILELFFTSDPADLSFLNIRLSCKRGLGSLLGQRTGPRYRGESSWNFQKTSKELSS